MKKDTNRKQNEKEYHSTKCDIKKFKSSWIQQCKVKIFHFEYIQRHNIKDYVVGYDIKIFVFFFFFDAFQQWSELFI